MIPNLNTPVRTLIDGGYFTWVHGTAGRKGWNTARSAYSMKNGVLFLMDSQTSARKEYYPLYKSHRAVKRAAHQDKTDMVRDFQLLLREDPSFRKLEVAGLEADDLIAIMIMLGYNFPTMGRDKDLLQLPGLQLSTVADEIIGLMDYAKSLPKRLAPLIKTEEDILFSLVLLGDKSDDIPRLLPPRAMDLGAQLMTANNRWSLCKKLYGDKFLVNLYLAVLPAPFCFDPQPTPEEVYNLVVSGKWPQGVLRKDVTQQIEELEALNVLSR